jgi:integrase
VNFDYKSKKNGLYMVQAAKGGGVRGCVISNEIINELKENHWQPRHTNRFNFAKYCQRLKKEAKLSEEVELTPHTGRRSFATYQAEGGTPLPVLARMLGHKSKKTTAEYY